MDGGCRGHRSLPVWAMPTMGLPGLQFIAPGQAEIQVSLDIERGHVRVVGIVEPVRLRNGGFRLSVVMTTLFLLLHRTPRQKAPSA